VAFDRKHVGPMAAALAAVGYLVCVPEFRRIGQAGGGWPGTFDDVAAAVDGRRPWWQPLRRAPATPGGYCSPGIPQAPIWPPGRRGAADLLGGGPEQHPQRYAVADPARLIPLGVSVRIVHGITDGRVPGEMSRSLRRPRARRVATHPWKNWLDAAILT
jgi:hypothetical protein